VEGSHQCYGVDRGTINVTDRVTDREAKATRVNSYSLLGLHLAIHYGHKLQDLFGVDKNRDADAAGGLAREHQGLLYVPHRQPHRETQR